MALRRFMRVQVEVDVQRPLLEGFPLTHQSRLATQIFLSIKDYHTFVIAVLV